MKNKLFLEFLAGKENLPVYLKKATEKDILLSFRAKSIFIKFLSYQLLGAIFSMTVCPQFGLGLVEGHGITHVFRMIGDWACAAFCGSLFLSAGMVVAFIGMKGEELKPGDTAAQVEQSGGKPDMTWRNSQGKMTQAAYSDQPAGFVTFMVYFNDVWLS